MESNKKNLTNNKNGEFKNNIVFIILNSSWLKKHWIIVCFSLLFLLLTLSAKFLGFEDRFTMAPSEPLEWNAVTELIPYFIGISIVITFILYLIFKKFKR